MISTLIKLLRQKSSQLSYVLTVLTYNRTLPNISEVVRKNWHILQINPEFYNVFVIEADLGLLQHPRWSAL